MAPRSAGRVSEIIAFSAQVQTFAHGEIALQGATETDYTVSSALFTQLNTV